jgi:hypothetical protein
MTGTIANLNTPGFVDSFAKVGKNFISILQSTSVEFFFVPMRE